MDRHACAECRELISAYIDGELAGDERARMMGHLATCSTCRETLEVYRLIGTRIRSMPPAQPPEHLLDAIFAETIDAQPRRLFILTSRVGYSVAAVAAVLLIFVVAVYLIVGGYQRGLRPQVASTEPGNGETWPIQRPIEITFNKKMDQQSVEAALAILPPEEDARLSLTWEGNTLIIGQNQTLLPGLTYQILIGGSAEDTFGNRLETDFRLSFGTTSTVQVPMTPTPAPTVQPTLPATTTAVVPTPTPRPPTGDATAPASPTATLATAPTSTPSGPGGIVGTPGTPAATLPPGDATPPTDPGDGVPVDPPTPTPAETPAPTPTYAPTASPTPTATPTPSPTVLAATATATASATPTVATIPVTGGFGDVYWGDATVRERLGAPLAPASSTGALQLGFQHGTMYYRGDTGTIYVLNATNLSWGSFLDSSTSLPEPEPAPEPDLWIPGGILGFLWAAEPSVSAELGYAVQQYPASFSALVQQFEGGVMLSSPETIWVLYDDLTWDWFSNSGG